MAEAGAACGGVVVAGMVQMADRPLRRAWRAAADGVRERRRPARRAGRLRSHLVVGLWIGREVRGTKRLGLVEFPIGGRGGLQQLLFALSVAEANACLEPGAVQRRRQSLPSRIVIQL